MIRIDKAKRARFAAKHPELAAEYELQQKRAKHRKQVYGLEPALYESLLKIQRGKCAICGKKPPLLEVDHCHQTGHVRGLLCRRCNSLLGTVRENADRARVRAVLRGLTEADRGLVRYIVNRCDPAKSIFRHLSK